MPERYTLAKQREELEEFFHFALPDNYIARYNAAPAQLLPVITLDASDGFSYFFWGTIPGWAGNKALSRKIINISAADLFTRPMYKNALQHNRCVVPSDGYFLWKKVGKKTRIPYRIEITNQEVVAFAGIWEEFEDENDQIQHSFRIVTVEPAPALVGMDESMPLILSEQGMKTWLSKESSAETLKDLAKPINDVEFYTVSSKIDNINVDNVSLLDKVDSMNQDGNYSLFD